MDGETEILKGRVCHITYKNEQNGYTVFKISTGGEEIVSVGNFPFISLGDTVSLKGKYIVHPVYGPQFAADECERETPSTILKDGISIECRVGNCFFRSSKDRPEPAIITLSPSSMYLFIMGIILDA